MTRRAHRRTLLGSLFLATALVATATPASARTITTTSFESDLDVIVTDCPPTAPAGVSCRGFSIRLESSKTESETSAITDFQVQAFALTTQGGGAVTGVPVSISPVTSGGKFVVALDAKTASVDLTANLVCDAPGCAIAGPHRFKLAMSKQPISTVRSFKRTQSLDSPTCNQTSTGNHATQHKTKGIGTVKVAGRTATIRVLQGTGDDNEFDWIGSVIKTGSPGCPAPTVTTVSFPRSTSLTGLLTDVAPPEAVVVSGSRSDVGALMVLHDCSPTSGIGSPCRVFVINGTVAQRDSVTEKVFGAEAYTATNLGGGAYADTNRIASTEGLSSGSITVAPTMKSGSLSMTVNFVCKVDGCPVSGAHTFKVRFTKSAASTIELETVTESTSRGDCLQISAGRDGSHRAFKGTASVKSNGSTRPLRLSTSDPGYVAFIGESERLQSGNDPCPITV